jgi:hypothetical protein
MMRELGDKQKQPVTNANANAVASSSDEYFNFVICC